MEKKAKEVKVPWDFKSPSYDERLMVSAGDHHGVGKKNPVSGEKPRHPIPMGRKLHG